MSDYYQEWFDKNKMQCLSSAQEGAERTVLRALYQKGFKSFKEFQAETANVDGTIKTNAEMAEALGVCHSTYRLYHSTWANRQFGM